MARLQDGSAGDDAPLARRGLALAALLLFACAQPSTEEPVKAKQEAPPPEEAPAPDPGGPPGPPLRADGTIFAGAEQMGTRVTIKVWVGDHSTRAAEIAIREAFAEIERIEEIASEWRPQSELSQFNAHAGREPIDMSADLFALLQRSKEIAAASGGTFDPTFHGVGQLWSFEPGAQPPPREAIAEKLKLVNWRAIELDPETHRGRLTNPGMKIGLGAIAKGYAVDRASELLRRRGFVHHIVEGGGDTYVSGTKGGKSWMVGIQDPAGPGSIGALPVSDRAVVTSGGYQRFFEFEGKRYAHIIDPRTGWPLDEEASALSVTVVAANATDADAFCTAVAVMGPVEGMKFVESTPELEAVILPRDGEPAISSGLQSIYVAAPERDHQP